MSLINEMLRNLEKRTSGDEQGSNAPETAAVAVNKGSSRYLLTIVGIFLLAVLTWGVFALIPRGVPEKPIPQPASTQPEEELAISQTDSGSSEEKQSVAVVEMVAEQNASPAVTDTVDLLDLEVVKKKSGASLVLNFSHSPEYRLIQKEGGRRLEMTFDQVQVGENFEIPVLPKNIKQISLIPQLQTLQLLVDLGKQSRLESYQLLNSSESRWQLSIEIETIAVVAQGDKKPAVAKPKPIPVIETVEIPVARVSKNRNKVAADQKAYRAGLKQLQGGHWVAAEAGFKQALSLNPELLDARLKLIRLYQQQAEFEQAEKLLREGLSLVPGDFVLRKILARQLFNDQRLGEAIELLEIQPQPRIGKDLEYHALLAALLQEAGRFDDARLLYSKLVQIRPQAALWWMGLAISLDQTDHPSSARDAYQRALVLPGLRPDLQDYIHNRLQVL